MIPLTELNQLEGAGLVEVFGGVFEHSPWVAERAGAAGPFGSLDELHQAMCAAMHEASDEEKLALIRKHPDLGDRLGALTDESATEQKAAGLDVLTEAEVAQFRSCNDDYRSKFGFPFVVCARLNDKRSILAAFESRLTNDRETEIATALTEIEMIAKLRLMALIAEA